MDQFIHIPVNSVTLEGDLNLPPDSTAVVIFAHGSGSSRLSPRNRFGECGVRSAETCSN